MAKATIDALTSSTLKHLREHWWNDEFTGFLRETLRPRPGNRILDVGCGTGIAEVSIGRLQLSQIKLFGVDYVVERVASAQQKTRSHNQRVGFAAADASRLPFADRAFDSTYCVAVLQHVRGVTDAVAEFARVTRPGGRIVAVEPDNAAHYWYSSIDAGWQAHDAGVRFFQAVADATEDATDHSIGPKLPTLFVQHGIDPLSVRLFPVSHARLGLQSPALWVERRLGVENLIARVPHPTVNAAGREYLETLARYADAATAAGEAFVEIQNTMLFATVAQRAA
jgi:ubiquinone/menaquinone biosynthesis C-methylase UbiE